MIISPYQYVAISFSELIFFALVFEILVAAAIICVIVKRKKA